MLSTSPHILVNPMWIIESFGSIVCIPISNGSNIHLAKALKHFYATLHSHFIHFSFYHIHIIHSIYSVVSMAPPNMMEPNLNQGNIPTRELETPSFDRYVLPHLDAPITNCYDYEDSDYEPDQRESRCSLSFNNPTWEKNLAIPNVPHKSRRIRL